MRLSQQQAGLCRRAVIRGVTSTLTAVQVGGNAGRISAQQKLSKADAKYQEQPNGQQRCEICLQFRPPASCQIVSGEISPKGWCQFFAARENAR
jgi:hypothetical protein